MFDENSPTASFRRKAMIPTGATGSETAHSAQRTAVQLVEESALRLAGKAFSMAYFAAEALDNVIIPELPGQRQAFAEELVHRLEGAAMLNESFRRDLDTLLSYIDDCIDAHTELGWISDDHHIDGGYEVQLRDDTAKMLGAARHDIVALHDSLRAALSAQHASQAVKQLL